MMNGFTFTSCLAIFLCFLVNSYAYKYAKQCDSKNSTCTTKTCGSTTFSVLSSKLSQLKCCNSELIDATRYVCYGLNRIYPCRGNRCNNGLCLTSYRHRCDGDNDCQDGSDESGCNPCRKDQFQCRNRRCISLKYVCDSDNDCADGSDEMGCVRDGTICERRQFLCKDNSKCIDANDFCNGKKDCADGSDELFCGPKGFGR